MAKKVTKSPVLTKKYLISFLINNFWGFSKINSPLDKKTVGHTEQNETLFVILCLLIPKKS